MRDFGEIKSDAGKDWRQEEKGTTEDEMVGWHHRLDEHEFEQAPGVGDGQGNLACSVVHGVTKSWTWLKRLSTHIHIYYMYMNQFSSVTQSCLTLCDPMDCSTPGFPVHHQLLELAQTHVHQVGDAIQPLHPLSSYPFLLLPSVFPSIRVFFMSSYQVAKVLEL